MTSARAPELLGLVLSGGDSRRMGADKGGLRYHRDAPQARHLCELLRRHVRRCFVAVNPRQRNLYPYADLPLIVDAEPRQGPASGLIAAHDAEPQMAWLVVAVDLVFLDDAAIRALIDGRQPRAAATALCHADGTIEPLFAIWEPVGLELLAARVREGDGSPRRCLEAVNTAILPHADPETLKSVDSPEDHDAIVAGGRERLDPSRGDPS